MRLYAYDLSVIWLPERPQDIHLALVEKPTQEALLSWNIKTRWKSEWLQGAHTLKSMHLGCVGKPAGVGRKTDR